MVDGGSGAWLGAPLGPRRAVRCGLLWPCLPWSGLPRGATLARLAAARAAGSGAAFIPDDLRLHATPERADVADDDLVADLQAILDLDQTACFVGDTNRHRHLLELTPRDAIDEGLAVLPEAHGGLGDDEHIQQGLGDDLSAGEGVSLELPVGIRDLHVRGDRARGLVNRRADAGHLAGEGLA